MWKLSSQIDISDQTWLSGVTPTWLLVEDTTGPFKFLPGQHQAGLVTRGHQGPWGAGQALLAFCRELVACHVGLRGTCCSVLISLPGSFGVPPPRKSFEAPQRQISSKCHCAAPPSLSAHGVSWRAVLPRFGRV